MHADASEKTPEMSSKEHARLIFGNKNIELQILRKISHLQNALLKCIVLIVLHQF